MKRLAIRLSLLSLVVCATACLGEEAPVTSAEASGASDLQSMKRDAAYEVANLLQDPAFQSSLDQQFRMGHDSVNLSRLLAEQADGEDDAGDIARAARHIASLDYQIRSSKGIETFTSSLLEVRLVRPAGDATEIDWATVPVAFLPAGEESEWSEIQAFDASGRTIVLDAKVQPDFPVLVAGINAREDLRAGIAYINEELSRRGLRAPRPLALLTGSSTSTSKLSYIRLSDDEEPWISGSAELYALVSGVDHDSDHVHIEAVDMPYLDSSGTSYHPNQILIFWETYRFAAANVQLYEHDDSTNYQTLVQGLVTAVESVLNLTAPEYSIVATIANQIIAAMPSGWFSNDDDYVDSFYTLEEGRTYTDHSGAANNARISLSPYALPSR